MQNSSSVIAVEGFMNEHKKHIQNVDVLFAEDVAKLFDISITDLHKVVNGNKKRFPNDFMFAVKQEQNKTERLAFTMAGILMLSGQLKSVKATRLSVQIINFIVAQSPNSVFDMIKTVDKNEV